MSRKAIMEILGIAEKTYYNWKNEKRPIMSYLEKYVTKEDVDEFLKTGRISRLELDKIKTESGNEIVLKNEFVDLKKRLETLEKIILNNGENNGNNHKCKP